MSRNKNRGLYSGYMPYNYSQLNAIDGHYFPSEVKVSHNMTFAFWERALFQRACSVVDFDLPEEWEGSVRDFFYYCLFRFGYLGLFYDKTHGYTFQPGSLYGYDWYYQFTNFVVCNPKQTDERSMDLKIHDQCEILKLCPDYRGCWDIISYYAEKLSGMSASVDMSIINSRLAYILGAKTKAAAEALKKILDQISNGKPTIVYDYLLSNDMKDKETPFQMVDLGVSKNYVLDKQLADFACLMNQFDSEVGIPCLPYTQKKERMITDEATMKTVDGTARSRIWKNCIESSLKLINNKYGEYYQIRATFPFLDQMEGGTEDVNSEDQPDRN